MIYILDQLGKKTSAEDIGLLVNEKKTNVLILVRNIIKYLNSVILVQFLQCAKSPTKMNSVLNFGSFDTRAAHAPVENQPMGGVGLVGLDALPPISTVSIS